MNCPICAHADLRVLRSTPKPAEIRRMRECVRCGHRLATIEQAEQLLESDRRALAKARELAATLVEG